jgi:hypothetical protein
VLEAVKRVFGVDFPVEFAPRRSGRRAYPPNARLAPRFDDLLTIAACE